MKYVILCLIALAVCIALGALVTALIGRSLKKRDRRLARPAAVLMTVVFALAIACAAMFGYLEIYYHADGEAAAALESGDGVIVSHEGRVWAFDGPGTRAALVFYPGAKVEAEAYAPLLRELAENGVDCFLAEMPFRMAIFGSGAAGDIIAAHDYEDWYVGGHSMGGMTAAGYAAGHPDEVAGVIMLAAYSTEKLDDGLSFSRSMGPRTAAWSGRSMKRTDRTGRGTRTSRSPSSPARIMPSSEATEPSRATGNRRSPRKSSAA